MTNFNLSFAPLVPLALLVALSLAAIIAVGLMIVSGRRGAWLRARGLALILLALADPSLVREDRDPLKDVVAVVLDRSGSQTMGERKAQTDRARELVKSLITDPNVPETVRGRASVLQLQLGG